ncbi:MAG: signal peptidase I [Acholeplasmataceae bacterium]|nr:signal peptidase I [Acholeplasmataceae bacterium]
MTLKKAYQTLIITVILMMLTIILYALRVTKLKLDWGMTGFVLAAIFSVFSVVFAIHQNKHQKEVKKTDWITSHRFEILDWVTFLSVSLMGIFVLFLFFILPSDVSQGSMSPTLEDGNRIIVYHFKYEPKLDDIVIVKITQEEFPQLGENYFYKKKTVCPLVFKFLNDDCITTIVNDSYGNPIVLNEIYFVKRVAGLEGDLVTFKEADDYAIDFSEMNKRYEIQINGISYKNPYDELYILTYSQKIVIEEGLVNSRIKEKNLIVFGDNKNNSTDSKNFGVVEYESIMGKVIFKLSPLGGVK